MGVVNNKIDIEKLKKNGGSGGDVEERLSHLEDEYTNLVSYKTDETEIGEWVNGDTIYREIMMLNNDVTLTNGYWQEIALSNNKKQIISIKNVGIEISGTFCFGRVNNNKVELYNPLTYPLTLKNGDYIILDYTKNEE